ncbi:hypothetical protein [Roseivivax sp.]
MRDRPPGRAPDYTTAALIMGGINLFWIFAVVQVIFGLPVVLLLGWLLNLGISRLAARRA